MFIACISCICYYSISNNTVVVLNLVLLCLLGLIVAYFFRFSFRFCVSVESMNKCVKKQLQNCHQSNDIVRGEQTKRTTAAHAGVAYVLEFVLHRNHSLTHNIIAIDTRL